MKKSIKYLCLIALALLAIPGIASAELDPKCWTEEECVSARMGAFEMTKAEALKGFYDRPEATSRCGTYQLGNETKVRGYCLPVGQTVTKISFGGKTTFSNMGEFIQIMYRYGLQIAGILAVIMIIVGGFQWTMSGGNASIIGEAKKRITGAVIGLVIAALSFTILQTINPQTTSFRLPSVWMINPTHLGSEYCMDIKDKNVVYALFKKDHDKKTDGEKASALEAANRFSKFTIKQEDTSCGSEYFIGNTNGQVCSGTMCSPGKLCYYPTKTGNIADQRTCIPAVIGGNIQGVANIIGSKGSLHNPIDQVDLIVICNDGTLGKILPKPPTESTKKDTYQFTITKTGIDKISNYCSSHSGVAGYYLGAETNDSDNLIGTGIDDWHAIGKNSADSHECSINLGAIGFGLLNNRSPNCSNEIEAAKECSCATINKRGDMQKLLKNPDFTQHLITEDDLKQGFLCNIKVARSVFPHLDGTQYCTEKRN
ncbi:pilin [Patescibacteria group bacterium]|nr:pilin [Patescibacteria group bacterium]MBU1722193.1 pilin [Patescibacteria group bacterium]MBU1901144.1 pilin [Patescibacteria group bacterium]